MPGCWSQGATEDEALENIEEAIREYVEVAEEQLKGAQVREVEVTVVICRFCFGSARTGFCALGPIDTNLRTCTLNETVARRSSSWTPSVVSTTRGFERSN
jgi:hypothetical protein